MKKLLFIIGLNLIMCTNSYAGPHHHQHMPVIRHYAPHHHSHSNSQRFWTTFAGATVGTVIGSFLVKDSYTTYNQQTNIPRTCITVVNQRTGVTSVQCSQDFNQVIYLVE